MIRRYNTKQMQEAFPGRNKENYKIPANVLSNVDLSTHWVYQRIMFGDLVKWQVLNYTIYACTVQDVAYKFCRHFNVNIHNTTSKIVPDSKYLFDKIVIIKKVNGLKYFTVIKKFMSTYYGLALTIDNKPNVLIRIYTSFDELTENFHDKQ